MPISLIKGENVSLSKSVSSLKRILVGLGWQSRAIVGTDFDLDVSAFLVEDNGKVREEDFIYYKKSYSMCGSVKHTGDNKTGEGDGDDEVLEINLEKIPSRVKRIVVCVTIYDAEARKQNFGQVSDAFVRVVNLENDNPDDPFVNLDNNEIVRFDLTEDYSIETAIIFGEIYRHSCEWKFKAVGQGFSGGLKKLCNHFGLIVIENDDDTALMVTEENDNDAMVAALLNTGAKVDLANNDGWTPLMEAAQNGHHTMVEALLKAGAKVDLVNNDGWTALRLAALNGHDNTVEALLKAGAKVDLANNDGWTPLMSAVRKGHDATVVVLLNAGAKVDLADKNGRTALMVAAQNGRNTAIMALLKAGAKVDLTDNNGRTALMMAAQNGHKTTVQFLTK